MPCIYRVLYGDLRTESQGFLNAKPVLLNGLYENGDEHNTKFPHSVRYAPPSS